MLANINIQVESVLILQTNQQVEVEVTVVTALMSLFFRPVEDEDRSI